ncbi:FUSC family protein [Actinacidiphila soli]|uniref:FUSC family protein n=1 Tax=Actinacidiphila soli TaxID=2487275 RepID=UPI0013E2F59A|nr:aromatic acid exporter family protein [Actinacidiphila soli]
MSTKDHLREQRTLTPNELLRRLTAVLRHPWRYLRTIGRPTAQTAKVTVACALSWQLASWLLGSDHHPVLAPLTALFTVQLTIYGTLRHAGRQIAGVLIGVAVALLFFQQFGVNWLTVGGAVGTCLTAGRLLRLGAQAHEVPTTVLLVVGSGASYGTSRFLDTLIGAGVGIAVNLLVSPNHLRRAGRSVRSASDALATTVRSMATGLAGEWTAEQAQDWLSQSHRAAAELDLARSEVGDAAEGVRLNPRRLKRAITATPLVEAVLCLSHVCDQVQAMARGLYDLAAGDRVLPGPPSEEAEEGEGSGADGRSGRREVLLPLGHLLARTGDCLEAFGRVHTGRADLEEPVRALCEAIDWAHERHAEAARALTPGPDTPATLWPLYGTLLDEAHRILRELDPEHGPHRQSIHPQPDRIPLPQR